MYKLTILFFFLTTFNSQGLKDSCQLKFASNDATYTLQIKEGSLVFENQPGVTIVANGGNSSSTDKKTSKIYKITKGATFEAGLKIGEEDLVAMDKIGEEDDVATDKIGGEDDVATDKIGGDDLVATDKEMNPLFGVKDHQAYEIILSYAVVRVVEKATNSTKEFPIAENGIYLNISGNKFSLFK